MSMPIMQRQESAKGPKNFHNCLLLWAFSITVEPWSSALSGVTKTHTHTHTQGSLLFAVMICPSVFHAAVQQESQRPAEDYFFFLTFPLLLYCFLPKKRGSTKDCRSPLPDLCSAPPQSPSCREGVGGPTHSPPPSLF